MMVGITRGFVNFAITQLKEDSTLNIDHEAASWIGKYDTNYLIISESAKLIPIYLQLVYAYSQIRWVV